MVNLEVVCKVMECSVEDERCSQEVRCDLFVDDGDVIVDGTGAGGGLRGIRREDLNLFEEPFDAVALLVWSKVGVGREGMSISSLLTMKTAPVRNAEGAAAMSWRRGLRARGWSRVVVCWWGKDRWKARWIVPSP